MIKAEAPLVLNTRELASVIIAVGGVFLLIAVAPNRRQIVGSFANVMHSLIAWKIMIVLISYVAWAAAVVYLSYRLGRWSVDLTKDTIIVVIFAGLPLIFNAGNFGDGRAIIRKVITEALGIAAIVVAYLNLAFFPLWAEIVLQGVVLVLVLLVAVASRDKSTVATATCLSWLIGAITFGIIIYTGLQVYWKFSSYDWATELRTFALSIWLPFALIPFVYVWGYLMACEMALVRVRWQCPDRSLPWRVQFAVVLGLLGSLRFATRFRFHWIGTLARETKFRGALHSMRSFRRAVRTNQRAERDRVARLKRFSDVPGCGPDGLRLDRREFDQTKDALIDVYYTQLGLYRQHHRYETDEDTVFGLSLMSKLPDDHSIQMRVSKGQKSWMAWRPTPGGYVFGVGGVANIDQEWRFDGIDPPDSFPSNSAPGWRNMLVEDESPEWESKDGPVPEA